MIAKITISWVFVILRWISPFADRFHAFMSQSWQWRRARIKASQLKRPWKQALRRCIERSGTSSNYSIVTFVRSSLAGRIYVIFLGSPRVNPLYSLSFLNGVQRRQLGLKWLVWNPMSSYCLGMHTHSFSNNKHCAAGLPTIELLLIFLYIWQLLVNVFHHELLQLKHLSCQKKQ